MTETRVTVDGLRRRRQCAACKRRFTTYEKVGPPNVKVAKRDGTIEPFDRDKLREALRRVAAHRNVDDADLSRIARDIEASLLDGARKSVAWTELATLVLDRLANVDPIAARRFAANYTDDTGVLRFDDAAPATPSPQLGLPLPDDDN